MTSIQACSPKPSEAAPNGLLAGGTVVDMSFAVFVMSLMAHRLKRNHIELAVADTAFGNQGLGKLPDFCGLPF